MENLKKGISFNGYNLREITAKDIDNYFKYGFKNSDKESKYYTGTIAEFTKDQISTYVKDNLKNPTRLDYLILNREKIIGEVVLSDIQNYRAHFRICIFNKINYSKGIGFKATKDIINLAFCTLYIKVIELEVFSFNSRAISLYKKIGFKVVEEIIDNSAKDPYKKIYLMELIK